MKVKIISGYYTGRIGEVVEVNNNISNKYQWVLVKIDGVKDPIYYLGCELEILH